MTGSGPLWRKANPFAAPRAILTLLGHGRGTVPSNCGKIGTLIVRYSNQEERDQIRITSCKLCQIYHHHQEYGSNEGRRQINSEKKKLLDETVKITERV